VRILDWDEFINADPGKPVAASVGVFDGVHRGHQRLLSLVKAKTPSMESCVITFRENPKRILRPNSFKGSIFSLEKKLQILESEGLDICVLIDFSADFGTLSGAEFLGLLKKAQVGFLTVGPNFRCGYKMDTNAARLAELCVGLGIEAVVAEPVLYSGHPISSTRIRNAIVEGRLTEASDMLGRPYEIEYEVEAEIPGFNEDDSKAREGKAGLILRPRQDSLLPPDGRYELCLDSDGKSDCLEASIIEGLIRLEDKAGRGSGRAAIITMVSRECKEK
jgi:riboflavin kinase/FMN adenylyltransferase